MRSLIFRVDSAKSRTRKKGRNSMSLVFAEYDTGGTLAIFFLDRKSDKIKLRRSKIMKNCPRKALGGTFRSQQGPGGGKF